MNQEIDQNLIANDATGSVSDSSDPATDNSWPDPTIYGDTGTDAAPPKRTWLQLLLGVVIGFVAASLLTLYVVAPVAFYVGYMSALEDVNAVLEAEAGQ